MSSGFWLKLKMILGAVIIFALCLGFALWMITPARGQGTAGPPIQRHMTEQQIDQMSTILCRLFSTKEEVEMTCEEACIVCDSCREMEEESIKRTSTFDNTERQKDPIREELEPR